MVEKNIKDTKRYIHLAIIPFVLGAILLVSFISNIDVMINYSFTMFSTNPQIATAKSMMDSLEILASESFFFKIVMFLGEFSIFLIQLFLFFILFGLVGGVLQAIFAPFIVEKIVNDLAKEENVTLVGYGNILKDLLFTVKELLKLVFFLFIAIPLFFIPLLNIFVFHLILYKFFHNTMQRDVGVYIFSSDEIKNIKPIYSTTIKLYLLNLIPIVNLFIIVYQIVSVTNVYLDIAKKIRN